MPARPRFRSRVAPSCRMHRQRGALAVVAAWWLGIAVATLGALDVGNVYVARRQLQRTADLAATAGAQAIGGGVNSTAGCAAAKTAAQSNATANGLSASATVTTDCGRWDRSAAGVQPVFSASGTPLNAVRVNISRQLPYLFLGPSRNVQVVATAKAVDVGTFTLSTGTATLSGGQLNSVLNNLLGTNVALSVLTYQNLAGAQVRLGDLATALNFGSVTQLLNADVRITDLVSAMAAVLGATVGADVTSALGTIASTVSASKSINIRDTTSIPGLLAVSLTNPQSAGSAKLSVLDVLMVAGGIAKGQSAIDLGAALNLGALATVTAQAVMIEPPVIAVGEAGQDAGGAWRASAHSAQVRVYLNVTVASIDLRPLVTLTGLNLPIYIEGAPGTAYLQTTQCTTSKTTSQSTVVAQPGIAAACVGNDAQVRANLTNYTAPASCSLPAALTSATIALVGSVAIMVGNYSPLAGLPLTLQAASPATLTFNAQAGDADDYQSGNTNGAGGAAGGLLTQVVTQLPGALYLTVPLLGNLRLANAGLLAPLINGVAAALTPVLNALDALLVPVLQLLGVQIGVSTVHDTSLSCGDAQLVN